MVLVAGTVEVKQRRTGRYAGRVRLAVVPDRSAKSGFYPFNAFRSLLGIVGNVTAPTYAELYAKKTTPYI